MRKQRELKKDDAEKSNKKKQRARKKDDHEEPQETANSEWLQLVTNDSDRKCWVPVGPAFQADVPAWTDLPDKERFRTVYRKNWDSVCVKNKVWPSKISKNAGEEVGEGAGRPDVCECKQSGSIECVRKHISTKRSKLRHELGFTFFVWGFDKMGEGVSSLWSEQEEAMFKSLVKLNPPSLRQSFLKPALESIQTKTRQAIINYYFNVYVPRRMSAQIRLGNTLVNTDNEEEDEESPSGRKSKKKRRRENKPVKTQYLAPR